MNDDIKTAGEIRRAFIDFFVKRGHVEVPSAPLVPKGDPTLLFTSAGMVQFKEFYLQTENLPYSRAASVQKCLRAGDLESVGRTLRHHTFFEMLGNFSFGDYFKREAIDWGWEFVTELLRLPEEKLYVSVFEEDDEAYRIWNERIGVPGERIVRLGRKDNFWGPVGETGICGPSSEIYYDTGAGRSCGSADCAPGCDCDRYIEFWNLVFPQFFLEASGEYRPLAKPGIDTGLGLERLAMIMQGVEDNFHTDLFRPIIGALVELVPAGVRIGDEERMSLNMIADHARALTFTISEGIYPSNEGRGYLIRRLLRRALTRFYTFGVERPFLSSLVDVVIGVMREEYPELDDRRDETVRIIEAEERAFFRTLEEGKSRFESIVDELKAENKGIIEGEKAFVLYDTFGFPIELTMELAAERGLAVDREGFEERMEEQRRRAQAGSSFADEGGERISMIEAVAGPTSEFTGYESVGHEARVMKYRVPEENEGATRPGGPGPSVEIVLDETPFYATSGGQVADRGWIELEGTRYQVVDVFKRGGDIVHVIETRSDRGGPTAKILGSGPRVRVMIDDERRLSIARNHTATHLLHAALRKVAGKHVSQAGSLVAPDRLRFDFNHFEGLSAEDRLEIERAVNGWIMEAIDVRFEWMDYQDAIDLGATALFDEKYGRKVRVVRIDDVSIELCGGTHVGNTGQIGPFVILSESGVAAGVRRIEALTGSGALSYVRSVLSREERTAALLKVSQKDIHTRAESLLEEIDSLKREVRRLEQGGSTGEIDRLLESPARVDGVLVLSGRVEAKDASALRNQADIFRSKVPSGIAVLSAPLKGKLQFIVTVTEDLIERKGLSAVDLVRELGEVAGGGGGGKKHLAQLGTKDLESEERVYGALPDVIRKLL